MIEYSEYVSLSPVKKLWKKKIPLTSGTQSPVANKSLKERKVKNKLEEIIIPFTKWIMPPQPEAYIKCRSYDFF